MSQKHKSDVHHDLNRSDILRRTVLLCNSFARNLAYYRVGQEPDFVNLLTQDHSYMPFFRQINSNFLDMAVIEWYKLIGDKKSKYHWEVILNDGISFKEQLYKLPELNSFTYNQYIIKMKDYRDKFVAHLDYCRKIDIPYLEAAHASIRLYHREIVEIHAAELDLTNLCDTSEKFALGYQQSQDEARKLLSCYVS